MCYMCYMCNVFSSWLSASSYINIVSLFENSHMQGCDGSVLLDDTPSMLGEKLALSNINSLRSFEVVDEIKEALEKECPGIVSCADIIIMASRDAVALVNFTLILKILSLTLIMHSKSQVKNVYLSHQINILYYYFITLTFYWKWEHCDTAYKHMQNVRRKMVNRYYVTNRRYFNSLILLMVTIICYSGVLVL